MEEQWYLAPAHSRPFHMGALPRQNHSHIARYVGSLDSADGNYLFAAACAPIPTVRASAYFLGVAPHIHDESLRWENRSRRAARAGYCENRIVTKAKSFDLLTS